MKLQNVLIAGALIYGTVYGLYGDVEIMPGSGGATAPKSKSELQSQISTRLSTGESGSQPRASLLYGGGPYSKAQSRVTSGGGSGIGGQG